MATNFTVNGKAASTDAPADTPLLWVIREGLKLTGTKFGCGTGLCGACMVHIDGKRAFSCQTQVSEIAGKSVTTIEGLSPELQPSSAEGLARRAGAAVRLLPVRPDHERGGLAQAEAALRSFCSASRAALLDGWSPRKAFDRGRRLASNIATSREMRRLAVDVRRAAPHSPCRRPNWAPVSFKPSRITGATGYPPRSVRSSFAPGTRDRVKFVAIATSPESAHCVTAAALFSNRRLAPARCWDLQ